MSKHIIPKEVFVGLQIRSASNEVQSADGGRNVALGFMTYKNNKDKLQHQESFDNWRDKEIPRFPYDNTPTSKMSVAGSVSRYSTQNKFIRVEDPRGFQLEITVENFIEIIRDCTLIKGIIEDGMIWGWNYGKLHLYKADSNLGKEGITNFKYNGMPNISLKDINPGDYVYLGNGTEGVYVGGWHIIENDYKLDFKKYLTQPLVGIKPVQSKRIYLIKSGDKYLRSSSLKIKKFKKGKALNMDVIKKEIYSEVNTTIEVITRQTMVHMICDYHIGKSMYNKYGLNSNGQSLLGTNGSDRLYNSFYRVLCISDKKMNQDDLYNKVVSIHNKVNEELQNATV